MGYYVASGAGDESERRFRVYRRKGWKRDDGVIRGFDAEKVRDDRSAEVRHERDHEVQHRAQRFADRLNAGGVAREQAMREASRQEAGR